MKKLVVGMALLATQTVMIAQTKVTDINPNGSSSPTELTALGNHLYFGATENNGQEPYELDTAGNVTAMADIRPGNESSNPSGFALAKGNVFFLASPANGFQELYKWESNAVSHIFSTNFQVQYQLPSNNRLTSFNGEIVVSHNDQSLNFGFEPYACDGQGSQLNLLKDVLPNIVGSLPSEFFEWNGELYFAAITNTNGRELWRYDGIGVTRVTDMAPGAVNGLPDWNGISTPRFAVYNNHLYFAASTGNQKEFGLYKYDGINAPVLVSNGTDYRMMNGFYEVNNQLVFNAMDASFKSHLYTYDDVNKEQFISDTLINVGTVFKDKVLFTNLNTDHGYELWEFDGIHKPQIVVDLVPGSFSALSWTTFSNFNRSLVFQDRFYFAADDGATGVELWMYDGVNPPSQVADIHPTGSASPSYLTKFNNDLYFTADDGVHGTEIWKLQGTPSSVNSLSQADFKLYPNPTSDYLQLETNEPITQIQVRDVLGRVVWQETHPGKRIDVSHLSRGTYILNMHTQKQMVSKVFTVQ